MMYSIGLFILDTQKELLLLESSQEIVSSHSRTVQLLGALAEAYPKIVSKNELTQRLWPEDDVTEWALSRQISQVRQLISSIDPDNPYIKTVHTKGFKLEIEPRILGTVTRPESNPQEPHSSFAVKNQSSLGKWLATVGLASCLMLGFWSYNRFKAPSITYGETLPEETIVFPVSSDWSSTEPDTINYTKDGLLIAPIGPDPLFVSTNLTRSAFYQGAVFSMRMQVNQEFVDHKGWLRLYYQSKLEGWPGEWDCGVDDKIIQTLDFEYHCVIDEKGVFTKILDDETVILGIKIHQLQPIGHAIIKAAKLRIPAGISTDKGWHATNGLDVDYHRGVSYHPKSQGDQLSTWIKGPVNIRGSKIAFTIRVNETDITPDAGLQFFILSDSGKWSDCFEDGGSIKSDVFTKICDFNNIQDPFVIEENKQVEIGIRPYGDAISKIVEIVGITISE